MSEITIQLTEKQTAIFEEAVISRGFDSKEEFLENCVLSEILDFRRNRHYRSCEVKAVQSESTFDFSPLVESVQSIAKSLATIEKEALEAKEETKSYPPVFQDPKYRTDSHL